MGVGRSLRVPAVLSVAAGWGALLWGLYRTPVSTDPELDLEAGPAFATTLTVYLPALALTVLLAALLAVGGLRDRHGLAAIAVAAAVALAFGAWVSADQDLSAYRPQLAEHLFVATMAYTVALLLVATAAFARSAPRAVIADRRP